MGAKVFLRVIGVALILGNLVVIGRYGLLPLPAGLMTSASQPPLRSRPG